VVFLSHKAFRLYYRPTVNCWLINVTHVLAVDDVAHWPRTRWENLCCFVPGAPSFRRTSAKGWDRTPLNPAQEKS
jgi:hypothetical protein